MLTLISLASIAATIVALFFQLLHEKALPHFEATSIQASKEQTCNCVF